MRSLFRPFLLFTAGLSLSACSETAQRGTTEKAASKLTVTNTNLALAPRVVPLGTATVTLTATIQGLSRKSTVAAVFTGDAAIWANASLPRTSQSGSIYTFSKSLAAPLLGGVHKMSWQLKVDGTTNAGAPVAGRIEVTCDDGVYCNGERRWVNGQCVDGPPPCDDGIGCIKCDEAAKACKNKDPETENLPPQCVQCAAKNCNPHCNRKECGDDGCGGKCTSDLAPNGDCLVGFCAAGKCSTSPDPGTCTNPLPLFNAHPTYGTTYVIPDTGVLDPTTHAGVELVGPAYDTSTGIDAMKVACGGDGIKELIFRLDVNVKMGVEIQMLSADGNNEGLDTVMALHKPDSNCTVAVGGPGGCSDDATPPGGLGSRVFAMLDPGSYRLVATGYSASQVGPFKLIVKAIPQCIPVCDGKFCGSDGCPGGSVCGTCAAGTTCTAGRCVVEGACEGKCAGRQCGDDGCGNSCGTCPSGELCAIEAGKCVAASTCNSLLPTCTPGCGPKKYCGTDCKCRAVDEPLIDLTPADETVLYPSITYEWQTFEGTSCGIQEGCVPGSGRWLLMKFSTDIWNVSALAGFKPGDPGSQPNLFQYHACHQHYHFSGFAQYSLLTWDGKEVLSGRKLSYCMEDSYQYLYGPNIACEPGSSCADQGIQAGWADSYPASLDCQWLVLKGTPTESLPAPPPNVAAGWYIHETCTNMERVFPEASYVNNCRRIPVYIPDVADGTSVSYPSIQGSLPPKPTAPPAL